jgi:hypothetical protein
MKIKIILKDKKLLKSSRVRKWLREYKKALERYLIREKAQEKIFESIIYGYPLRVEKDGSLKVIRDFYTKRKNRT